MCPNFTSTISKSFEKSTFWVEHLLKTTSLMRRIRRATHCHLLNWAIHYVLFCGEKVLLDLFCPAAPSTFPSCAFHCSSKGFYQSWPMCNKILYTIFSPLRLPLFFLPFFSSFIFFYFFSSGPSQPALWVRLWDPVLSKVTPRISKLCEESFWPKSTLPPPQPDTAHKISFTLNPSGAFRFFLTSFSPVL